MSSLTEQERLGLDDVFLSISSGRDRHERWRGLKAYLFRTLGEKKIAMKLSRSTKILFHVQKRLKSSFSLHILSQKRKKKRELRK